MPDIALRTAFIVGYPGETEEEFQVLMNYNRPETDEFIEGPHAINSTIIGNYIYFIDPQTDEFWVAYMLEKETIKG